MSRLIKRHGRVIGVTAAAALLLALMPASGAQAAELAGDPPASACTITGYSPSTIVMGIKTIKKTFSVTATGCTLAYWELHVQPLILNPIADGTAGIASINRPKILLPAKFLMPGDAGEGRTLDGERVSEVRLSALGTEDPEGSAGAFAEFPIVFLRETTFGSTFNASPEPVKKGKKLTIKGKLIRAYWGSRPVYHTYKGAQVEVQFKATGAKSYKTVKTVTAGKAGKVSTTVKATKSGRWRLFFAGNSTSASSKSKVDLVKVK